MSNELDPLESELANLRPIRPTPSLRAGVAERVTHQTTAWRRIVFGAAAAIAAGVALSMFLPSRLSRSGEGGSGSVAASGGREEAVYSLADLNRAARRSPDALDALLADEAAKRSRSSPEAVRAFGRTQSVVTLRLGGES
jgi:hypothetical protein